MVYLLSDVFPRTMTHALLSIGHALTQPDEVLQPLPMEALVALLRTDAPLTAETARLRKIATLDATAYRTLKTRLPYVVGAVFEDGKRHTDRLLAAHYFILDFDDFPLHDTALRQRLQQQPTTQLVFVSPSGKGLKVFCRLDSPCTDPKAYKEAYRAFASQVAADIRLVGSLDLRTSDAARACFLAHDPEAYYRPEAEAVRWEAYLAEGRLEAGGPPAVPAATPKEIDQEAYRAVLQKINPRSRPRPEKQLHVPAIFEEVAPMIEQLCAQQGLTLVASMPLNYGLKYQVKKGTRTAELNVFYGKRGFSVVRSPKTGSDPQLAETLYQLVYGLFFRDETTPPDNDTLPY